MLQAELKVISGKQEGAMIPLPLGKFLIGREEDCHLRPNSDLVSRHHCVFSTDEYSLRVRDLGSTNGTFVNGERLRGAVMLNSGDRVSVGKLEFEVAIKEVAKVVEPGEEETATDAFNKLEAAADAPPETGTTETLTEIPAIEEPPMRTDEETVMLQGGDTAAGIPTHQQPNPQQPNPQQMTPPPGYGQMPMGYPPQYMQSPYGYPGYPMPPMPGYYPQQAMPYPPMQQPGYPMPPQQNAPQPEAPQEEASDDVETTDGIPIRLPDPSETGAKEPEPKVEKKEGDEKSGKESPSMTGTAEDIIKQYLHRRPKSS